MIADFTRGSIAALAVTTGAQQTDTAPANSKLTTVLADLVKANGSSTRLTTESQRPRSVNDAMQSRRLRIDTNNEVQVYILMGAVTDSLNRMFSNDVAPVRALRDFGLGVVDRMPLIKAGLIRRERDGHVQSCVLDAAPMASAAEWIQAYRSFWTQKFDRLAKFIEKRKGT